jgi:hypothetical protein
VKPECIRAVQEAASRLGRAALTDAQINAIDARLQGKMRELARTDPEWQAKSYDQRVAAAAQAAMADIQAAAARKVENAERQILKTAATESRIAGWTGQGAESRAEALVRDIEATDNYITGIRQEAMSGMVGMIDAAKGAEGAGFSRRALMFLFDADNPVMTADLAREIFRRADGSTGNQVAKLGAEAYLKTVEPLRQRFNAAGGDVGQLDYGYIPQPHDAAKVRKAGQQAWVDAILPLLDRSRYVLEDGGRMGDVELRAVLGRAFETISTDGLSKSEPGSFRGNGAKANAGSEARQIHFADADGYLAYMQQFGSGGMYDAVLGHVGRMSRDIGLVERYGPNPNAQMRLQFDLAQRADGGAKRVFALRPESYWDQVSGVAGTPQSASLASFGMHARNVQVFGKLGGAVISSITDLGTFAVTTGYNRLPYWQAIGNIGRTMSKDTRDFMTAHGLIAESMSNDLSRWTEGTLKQTWSGRLANSTMKLSLMNAWTDTLRRAFSLTMMQGLARLSRTEWDALGQWDRALLQRKGIDADDWAVITRAELTEYGGLQHLTPESIRASGDARSGEVVAKVLGLIQDEAEFAVINPDLATKTMASGGATQAGTVKGELARSVMQFKSFPIAMVSRHWRRMLDAPTTTDSSAPALANRLMYGGALMLTTTALGAIALQGKQVTQGKDPIDMTGPHAAKFWAKAVAQGGGLSIVGDFLLSDPADNPGGFASNMAKTAAGPALGAAAQGLGIAVENSWKAINDKETHTAAQTVQLLRGHTPYLGLWYAKAAVDHAGLHAMQENLSPGYLSKMRQRAAKDWGQDYWWKPGTGGPDRAPDLARAVGE